MLRPAKISLCLPGTDAAEGYFTFRLQRPDEPSCMHRAVRRLFAVPGHKDQFKSFCHLLIKQQIVDRRLGWTFGEGHLVIFGNSDEHGPPDANWWWFLYALEQKARARGGAVHFLPGPHELIYLDDSWQFEHPAYPAPTAKLRSPLTALYNANFELWQWLGTRNIVEKIGQLLFVHHDLLPLLHSTPTATLTELNVFVRTMGSRLISILPATIPGSLPVDRGSLPGEINKLFTTENLDALLLQSSAEALVTGDSMQTQISIDFAGKLIHTGADYAQGNPAGLFIQKRRLVQADRRGHRSIIKKL